VAGDSEHGADGSCHDSKFIFMTCIKPLYL
jgi:hypothetical protein